MIITYHGAQFFKVQFGDVIIAFNPVSKESKIRSARFGAHIAIVSLNHPDTNGIESVTYGEKKPFSVIGPGEYEIKDIFIKGWPSASFYGSKEKRINTVYSVLLENMNLLFVGALSNEKDFPTEAGESTESVDILFLPIGEKDILSPEEASKLALKIEPKIIIPMIFGEDKSLLKKFLKEMGDESVETKDRLTLKKKDLEGKESEVVLLSIS